MSLSLLRYYCLTDTDEKKILVIPNWSDYDDMLINSGSYDLPTYLSEHPVFPLEATWFCGTELQKQAAIDMGFPSVTSIQGQIMDGTTKWYINSAKTKYFEFKQAGNGRYQIFAVYPAGGVNLEVLTLYPDALANDNKLRYSTLASSKPFKLTFAAAGNQAYGLWSFQSINNLNLVMRMYYYYRTYYPDARFTDPGTAFIPYKTFWEGVDPMNPYTPIGDSVPGGGDGEYDDESEANPPSSLPTTSFVDAGFCRIYNPNLGQLRSLSQYLWTDTTFLQTVVNHLKQLLENPMDAIISLSLLPIPIPQGTAEEVKVMYIPTGVYMPPATQQFIDVDCGSLTINKNIGCALDYNPYTRIHLYLPYIGQVTLNTDEVMGKTLHLFYRVDIVTGICTAFITVNGNVMYLFSGHCSVSQPLTSADFSGYINAMITAAKSVAAIAAGAGGAPAIAAGIAGGPGPRTKTTTETSSAAYTSRNPSTGRQITRGTSSEQFQRIEQTDGAQFGELASKGAANTVASVMNSKLVVEHTSGFGGNSGYLAQRTPFLIIERPRLCNPKEYGTYNGYPSMMYLNLGDCSGYTEVQQVQLTGLNATNPELSEISELLKSGVIL